MGGTRPQVGPRGGTLTHPPLLGLSPHLFRVESSRPGLPLEFWALTGPTWVWPLLVPVLGQGAAVILSPPGGLPVQGCTVGCRFCRGSIGLWVTVAHTQTGAETQSWERLGSRGNPGITSQLRPAAAQDPGQVPRAPGGCCEGSWSLGKYCPQHPSWAHNPFSPVLGPLSRVCLMGKPHPETPLSPRLWTWFRPQMGDPGGCVPP